jgi:alkanesulfonate monooxygenase SsuD/methylene tetrahydromethanopterin reductase-like flavin-dependent oxidoreductase (luciferase family)
MEIGTIGVWRSKRHGTSGLDEIEALGYGAFWLGGSPSIDETRPYLEATTTLPVLTGILNIWQHDPREVAQQATKLRADSGGRFTLGIGVGHPEATSDYTRPLKAALAPKMLALSKERALGTHPYFVDHQHAAYAREQVGEGVLVAPEVAVVVEPDDETARRIAREYAATYLNLTNYTNNLLRFGYTEQDIADGGSDRLIDAVIPHGSAGKVAEAIRAHLEAGADHVCIQPLGHGGHPSDDYRALAEELL